MSSWPPRSTQRGIAWRSPAQIYLASADGEDPLDGPSPVRLTNAPLLFATTLSVALGITAGRGDPEPAPDTDPLPSSAEPSTERMPHPPAW
jgi:hypothetical protein